MKTLFPLRTPACRTGRSVPPYPRTLSFSLILTLLLTGCSPSINSFYNNHKTDPGVTAVQVPDFFLDILAGSSPEMNNLMRQVDDVRFMTLPSGSGPEARDVAMEINRITSTGYTDVYRRTEMDNSLSLFSIKEKGSRIKELIWFDQGENKNLLLYFKGDFDPELISKLSDNKNVEDLKDLLKEEY
ncbi:DUF4252 domain-containing protein [Robertkochia marina]|nr:DUF4252 domain-containing protein [Robertkochia marina]